MTHPLETPIPSARKRMNRYARAAVLPMALMMSASFSAGCLPPAHPAGAAATLYRQECLQGKPLCG